MDVNRKPYISTLRFKDRKQCYWIFFLKNIRQLLLKFKAKYYSMFIDEITLSDFAQFN